MLRKPRILVVDNDSYTLEATTAMLKHLGYSTQAEAKSSAALRTFSDNPDDYDLVIVEPMMPELTGVELATRLRHISKRCPVMLYTGYIDEPLAETIKTAGLEEPVLKPLGLQELGQVVKSALPS
jgi:CheY-like chemotaxis protein